MELHTLVAEAVPRSEDALVTMINLTSFGDNNVWSMCEQLVRRVAIPAMDQNNTLCWNLLLNLSSTRKLDNKKAFLQSGISLPRLVSEHGLAVLTNLCAHGADQAALVEAVVQPSLTFIASGMERDFSLEVPMDFIANLAACGENYKPLIFNDPRLLTIVARALDALDDKTRLSAVRCCLNLTMSGEASDDQQQSSPRSPMLRIVQARVLAAASRSPLRFAGMHYSPSSSSPTAAASRQSKLVSAGVLERLQRIAADEDNELIKETAAEAVRLLS